LSTGGIIGIVLAVAAIALVVLILTLRFCRRKKPDMDDGETPIMTTTLPAHAPFNSHLSIPDPFNPEPSMRSADDDFASSISSNPGTADQGVLISRVQWPEYTYERYDP